MEDSDEILDEPADDFDTVIRDRKRKKNARGLSPQIKSAYDPAIKHCVLGSAAEVECVWSMAGHVLTEHRALLSPLIFELIMYLKFNSPVWGLEEIVGANKNNRKDSKKASEARHNQKKRVNEKKAEKAVGRHNWRR